MSDPTITFKHTNTAVDHALQDLFEKKMKALEKYLRSPEVLCAVEFRKETPRANGNIYVVEVNLTEGGQLYRVEACRESFEQAIDEARDELDKELRRNHKKRNNLFIKGARRVKEMVRWGS